MRENDSGALLSVREDATVNVRRTAHSGKTVGGRLERREKKTKRVKEQDKAWPLGRE